jgi:hypothetical protein
MTCQQLHTMRVRELAQRLMPLSAGQADLLSDANSQVGPVPRLATDIAARLDQYLDGA